MASTAGAQYAADSAPGALAGDLYVGTAGVCGRLRAGTLERENYSAGETELSRWLILAYLVATTDKSLCYLEAWLKSGAVTLSTWRGACVSSTPPPEQGGYSNSREVDGGWGKRGLREMRRRGALLAETVYAEMAAWNFAGDALFLRNKQSLFGRFHLLTSCLYNRASRRWRNAWIAICSSK